LYSRASARLAAVPVIQRLLVCHVERGLLRGHVGFRHTVLGSVVAELPRQPLA
jgi:hypothetical protein